MGLFSHKDNSPATPVAQGTTTMSTKPNGFVSFLDAMGTFFKKFLTYAVPIEQAAAPYINLIAPGVGTAMNLITNEVMQVETAFANANAAGGTGPQKSAQVLSTIGPSVIQLLKTEGITAGVADVQNMINAAVAILNAIPAPTTPAPAKA